MPAPPAAPPAQTPAQIAAASADSDAKSSMIVTTIIGCSIVLGLCGLIYFLHKQGAVHRDISGSLAKYGSSFSKFGKFGKF